MGFLRFLGEVFLAIGLIAFILYLAGVGFVLLLEKAPLFWFPSPYSTFILWFVALITLLWGVYHFWNIIFQVATTEPTREKIATLVEAEKYKEPKLSLDKVIRILERHLKSEHARLYSVARSEFLYGKGAWQLIVTADDRHYLFEVSDEGKIVRSEELTHEMFVKKLRFAYKIEE
jgi:hypothetical protein